MLLNLRDVLASDSLKLAFDYSIDFSGEEINFEFPLKAPVAVKGELQSKADVFYLLAQVVVPVSTHCARCGKPVHYEKVLDIHLVIAQSLNNEEGGDDIYLVEGDKFELDDIIREELILAMDMTVLCSEDCKGLCPKCGQDWNLAPCGCEQKEIDPRLAKLKQLL